MRFAVRSTYVLTALALVLLFLQPSRVAAQTTDAYTLTKTASAPFACNAVPTDLSTLTYAASQNAQAGQCVAFQISITNSASSADAITSLALQDTLNNSLYVGQAATAQSASTGQACYIPSGSGYTCTVTTTAFNFSTNGQTYSLSPGATGTEFFVAQVASGLACNSVAPNTVTAPTVANGSTSFTQTNVAAATATVTVTCPTTPSFTATKQVSVNGQAYGTTGTANVNDTLRYVITVTNNSGSTATGVAVTDTLANGQGLIMSSTTPGSVGHPCTLSGRTLTCPTADIPNGSSATVVINTVVQPGVSVITNSASVTTTSGQSATTNQTTIAVTSVPVTTSGTVTVCGVVTAYTAPGAAAGSVNIGGLVIPLAPVAVAPTVGFTIGTNICATFVLNSAGQATQAVISSNLATVTVVCGVFTISSTTGFVVVGGMAVPVATNATFVPTLVVGLSYCFLLNGGVAFVVITGIPTAVHPVTAHHYFNQPGYNRPN